MRRLGEDLGLRDSLPSLDAASDALDIVVPSVLHCLKRQLLQSFYHSIPHNQSQGAFGFWKGRIISPLCALSFPN